MNKPSIGVSPMENPQDDSALLPRTFLHVLRVELPSFSCSCDLAPDLQAG
jgi:hypothetical protein